jgi:hypothetical protein
VPDPLTAALEAASREIARAAGIPAPTVRDEVQRAFWQRVLCRLAVWRLEELREESRGPSCYPAAPPPAPPKIS